MSANPETLWSRFQRHHLDCPSIGLALDISRVPFPDDFHAKMERPIRKAMADMEALERGAIANPDEQRMVGHYWLRNPALAPQPEITRAIEETLAAIAEFTGQVHSGALAGESGAFQNLLVIGIGGSALGPQFVAKALGHPATDRLRPYFFDNTDPDGMDQVLAVLNGNLGRTLVLVISKSGGTPETRNGMLEARAAYGRAGLRFAAHTVAVTGEGSALHRTAVADGWLRTFPMWDWVGGRTSELSAVGLLPAALQGLDIEGLLAGAKACDEATRNPVARDNPAAQLALMWYFLGEGRGAKDMVVLPYKDRFELFSRYLQQLVMESLGKELDLDGRVVHQGLAVYGNKGSTDQHAYVQQLRDGVANFFAVFIEVLKDREGDSLEVEPGATSGDFLGGFLLGTRSALHESGRPSLTITVPDASAFTVGVLIALFERAVGLYASLVNINAYHQPGVEAGKKAAAGVLDLQRRVVAHLAAHPGESFGAEALASALGRADAAETVFKICTRLAANRRGVAIGSGAGLGARFKGP
ncbi:MAG: glucose-6-phosphate isomerase [Verrucomicrobiota bacterium]